MAAMYQYTHFRDTPSVDALCPKCFKPSLKQYVYQRVDMDGITTLGNRIACVDERIWITELELIK